MANWRTGSLACFLMMQAGSFAQPGTIDTDYGNNGYVTWAFEQHDNYGRQGLLTADGKLLVLAGVKTGFNDDIGLVRFLETGAVDSTFGAPVGTITDLDDHGELGLCMALRPDGKVLVAGVSTLGTSQRFFLARYMEDGTLDNGFGTGGVVLHPVTGNTNATTAMELQPDGKILLTGYLGSQAFISRFNADGSPDTGFSSDGTAIADSQVTGMGSNRGNAVKLLADGRILVAGRASNTPTDVAFLLLCYDQSGNLAPDFGVNGVVLAGAGGDRSLLAVTQRADGRIVAAGYLGFDMAVVQFSQDGEIDTGFDGDGIATLDFGFGDEANAVEEIGGQVIIAGTIETFGLDDMALAMFSENGALDAAFGNGGTVTVDMSGMDSGRSLVQRPDGGFYLIGGVNQLTALGIVKFYGPPLSVPSGGGMAGITVAPNPVGDQLVLNGTSVAGTGRLLDVSGRAVMSFNCVHLRTTVDTQSLPAGTYLLRYEESGKVQTQVFCR